MPAWTHPKTPRGDRDLKGKWPSADTIHYKATVDDPTIFTRTRKGLPLRRNPDDRIYEYACHEGNYALLNFIRGSQFPSGAEAKTVTVEIPWSPGLNLSVVGVVRGRCPLAKR